MIMGDLVDCKYLSICIIGNMIRYRLINNGSILFFFANESEDFSMFSIFTTSEEIQNWIDKQSTYKSQDELIESYAPLVSDFDPDDAYAEVNNFKSDDYLDNFTTQYDGVLGALQIAYFEMHLNVDPLDHITASPDLVTLDNMPPINVLEPEQIITHVNRWRIRQYLKGK